MSSPNIQRSSLETRRRHDETFVTFEYEGLRVRMTSPVEAPLDWLREFLSPFFDITTSKTNSEVTWDYEVRLVISRQRHEQYGRLGDPCGEVDCFAVDAHVIRLPWWSLSHAQSVVFDTAARVFYVLHPEESLIEVVADGDSMRVRTRTMRVVREVAMHHGVCRGGFFIHASAFDVHGRSVMISAPTNGGKTTLLTHALSHPETRFLSNDRVFVRFDGDSVIFRGMPAVVSMREGMLNFFPDLRDKVRQSRFFYCTRDDELFEWIPDRLRPDDRGRYLVAPHQFCALLGTAAVAQARAAAIVFPRIVEGSDVFRLTRIDPDVASTLLSAALFHTNEWRKNNEIFSRVRPDCEQPAMDVRALGRRLVARVPCYSCDLSRDAYRLDGGASDFVRAVLET